ncbi:MAG: nitronate monooxygenase [Dehalococcoidales bacterium]|nr:nitronate monooxygenase [Dehalococcoidales bacterium]
MEWKTRITEFLGCKYPIMQGAMAKLGGWQFAAAVANAGAHGTITASISGTPQKLKEDIRKCKEACSGASGTFGVNLSIGICPEIEQMLTVCIEERIPIETSVYKPDALAPRIKASGLPWMHKAARVKDAVHAVEVGAGAIILVGLEGAGIKNPTQLPTMTTILWGRRNINVPLVASGGIGDAHGFMAALGMGADGIMMGTAFLATSECPIKNSSKEGIINLTPDSPELRQRVMIPGTPVRPTEGIVQPAERDWSLAASFAAGAVDKIPTVQEFIQGIMNGAEAILDTWEFLKTK